MRTDNSYIDYVMGQGPLILGHRPAAVIEAVTAHPERARIAVLAGPRPRGRGGRGGVRTACPSVDLVRFSSSGTEAAMYALRFARAFTGRDADRALRGPLPRLVGRDPLVGPPLRRHLGRAPTRRRCCPGRPASPAPSAKRCWSRAGTTPRRWSAPSGEHGERIAAVITEPILGNCGGDHAGARLPRADARAGHRCRRAADLRRGADGLSRSRPAAPRSCSGSTPT